MKRKVTQQEYNLERAKEYLASLSLSPDVHYSVHAVGALAIRVDFYRSNVCIGFLHVDTVDHLISELSFSGTYSYVLAG